jgi:CheY-like chemotaxis protein/anti-sigma regulatory factor (Ser/Thr protein kinase)
MSHELRTPLNALLGFAQLLELKEQASDDEESTEQILRAGRHLLGLINEILDLSRIETGSLGLSPEPVELVELVEETASLVRPLAAERRIAVEVSDAGAGATARADRQRLKQVLLNLASNAVKYNHDEGTIRFACAATPDGKVRIDVADTGPGLSDDQIGRLFVPFERLGAENTGVEGTGIGLALSRHLVEAMAGTLEVRSTPGEGATFTVELPAAQNPLAGDGADEADRQSEALAPDVAGGVLYIEDNPSNLRLVERIVSHRDGIQLFTSTRGAEGLDLARAHHPDLILLDLHLPDLGGGEVLARLQADPATSDIPVVIVSADATPGQIDRLMAAGALHYLTKPLDVGELLAVLDRLLAPTKAST